MNLVTIITPTYNREKYLGKLYQSLVEQTDKAFKWIIVDDGSIDGTGEICEKFAREMHSGFEIQYIYQENAGKHVALNTAMKIVDTELVFIVDSDDYLPNTSIQTIIKYHEKYKSISENKRLCGYSFLRCHADGKVNTAYFPQDEMIDTYCNIRINGNIGGDKAEVFYTDILKKFPFPTFKDERFLAEDVVWMQLSGPYNMVHINENVYICDYLEDGLTNTGRRMKIKAPRGMMFRSQIYLNDKNVCLKVKVKMMFLYLIYSHFAQIGYKEAIQNIKNKVLFWMLYVPSYCIYVKWNREYQN